MIYGYARVSTKDQKLEIQLDKLEAYGCDRIFQEKKSAVKERIELDNLISHLRSGDTVVVWKLDRLGRSLKHLVNTIAYFQEMKVDFISLNDNIDTTTSQGRLMFNLFASFAEFERDLISERTKAGLEAAKARGRQGGRKKGLPKKKQNIAFAALQRKRKGESPKEIQKACDIPRATYYRYIKWAKENE